MGQDDSIPTDGPITALEFRPITSAVENGWLTVSVSRIVIHAENKFDSDHGRFVDVEIVPPDGKEILMVVPACDNGPAVGEQPANTITVAGLTRQIVDAIRNKL